MSEPRGSPLGRAASEPDLTALPQLYAAEFADVDVDFPAVPLPGSRALPGISLAPPDVPQGQVVASVTFSEYVAAELARSSAPSPTAAAGPGNVHTPTLDIGHLLSVEVAPRSPRAPSRSPRMVAVSSGRARSFDEAVFDEQDEDGKYDTTGSTTGFFTLGPRHVQLACLEINMKGEIHKRQLTRSEILAESRETLHAAHPSMSDAVQWMRELDTGSGPPEMETFVNLMDGGPRGKVREVRDNLRVYLRNYLRNSLQPRDIRQVDPAFAAKPALWIRHTALVVSLERLRAIVFRSKLLLFEPDSEATASAAEIASSLIGAKTDGAVSAEGFGGHGGDAPFELRALEGILIAVVGDLESDFWKLKPTIERHLRDLPNDLTTKRLEELRLDKQRLSNLRSRATAVHDILEKVLDEDEDMANMYLTEKHTHPERARSVGDHDEVEMLLEAYLQSVDELVNQSTLLSDGIEDTEDLVMIHLDTLRNRLLTVELALSVVSMTFGVGGMISGIFGMNLPIAQFDEGASTYWFAGVSAGIIAFVIIVSWLVLRVLRMRGLYSSH